MPTAIRQSTNDRPLSLLWRIVSSQRIAPLMLSARPGAEMSSSRQARRISTFCAMPSAAKRASQVGVLSSIASRPLPLPTKLLAHAASACEFMPNDRPNWTRSS